MNCREAQSQLFAERDGALDAPTRAALDGHLAQCGDCQRRRENLTAALAAWRIEVVQTTVPNAELEWHAVRRRIRGAETTSGSTRSRSPRQVFAWFAVPLGAAAAVALALFVGSPGPAPVASLPQVARANTVEVAGDNATVVVVDDQSGWLFVWASAPNPYSG